MLENWNVGYGNLILAKPLFSDLALRAGGTEDQVFNVRIKSPPFLSKGGLSMIILYTEKVTLNNLFDNE